MTDCQHVSSASVFPVRGGHHLPCCLKCGAELPEVNDTKGFRVEDPLAPARGILIALALSVLLWAAIVGAMWWAVTR